MIHLPVWDMLLLPGFGLLLIPVELLLVQAGREGLAGPTAWVLQMSVQALQPHRTHPKLTRTCVQMSDTEGKEHSALNHEKQQHLELISLSVTHRDGGCEEGVTTCCNKTTNCNLLWVLHYLGVKLLRSCFSWL